MKLTEGFLEGVAAAAVDEGLVDAYYATVATALGKLLVIETPQGVCRIGFEEEDPDALLANVALRVGPRIVRAKGATSEARDALEAYLSGAQNALDLPVDLALAPSTFGRSVLAGLAAVPRGTVTTYASLASSIGRPGAARAVGTALGRNPVPIVIPCHRVVPGGGGVGGYAGGAARKELLLRLEGYPQGPTPSRGS